MESSAIGKIQQEANSSIKNESTKIPEESRTSSGNASDNEQLVIDIATMLKTLEIPVSDECRIYRVPYRLRKWNEEAYTPHVISIGPYHHNKEKFQNMEKHKGRYFKNFVQRAENEINLENLVTTIWEMEDIIRSCYVDTVQLVRDDFVKMIILDATFILELFLKSVLGEWTRDDPMLVEECFLDTVTFELLLLENQLPFLVIKKLYHLALPSFSNSLSLIQLTFRFFNCLNIHNKAPDVEIKHFTDLLRFFQLPMELPERHKGVVFPKYSATRLHEAGVKLRFSSGSCQDLKFKKGVLEIPLLDFMNYTEAYVRNIMALEQCDPSKALYVTDFFLVLDHLINTTKDVDLLCDKGIVVNRLGDNNVVASIVSNLNRDIRRVDMSSNYYQLCEDLNAFYEEPWKRWTERWFRWKALLRNQYFSSPWRSASTIAAIILLGLTLVQTIFSIMGK